jgi:hypothetical protein
VSTRRPPQPPRMLPTPFYSSCRTTIALAGLASIGRKHVVQSLGAPSISCNDLDCGIWPGRVVLQYQHYLCHEVSASALIPSHRDLPWGKARPGSLQSPSEDRQDKGPYFCTVSAPPDTQPSGQSKAQYVLFDGVGVPVFA